MKFSTGKIDQAIEKESAHDQNSLEILDHLAEDQPALAAYLAQDNFQLLTADEHDYLIFLTTVIYRLYSERYPELPLIDEELLDECEEINWEKMSSVSEKKFSRRIDTFFENFAEEDLLAFVEDALEDDDMSVVSKEGREPMFIALKTLIDAFEKAATEN